MERLSSVLGLETLFGVRKNPQRFVIISREYFNLVYSYFGLEAYPYCNNSTFRSPVKSELNNSQRQD